MSNATAGNTRGATFPRSAPSRPYRVLYFPKTILEDNRLSTSFRSRCTVGSGAAFLGGLGLGVIHGSKTAALRFRAENSHRFPTTSTGWYLYHKSKNYNCMFSGINEGFKLGLRIPVWTALFFYIEEAIDDFRDTRDFASTVAASLTVSGVFSIKNQFNMPTAARTAGAGLKMGLLFGILQDAMALAKGRRVDYVDSLEKWWKYDATLRR
ncbi:MAG: hypothetical protein Q9186_003492 [Xanthomendoza sp. 1 TL-2023]